MSENKISGKKTFSENEEIIGSCQYVPQTYLLEAVAQLGVYAILELFSNIKNVYFLTIDEAIYYQQAPVGQEVDVEITSFDIKFPVGKATGKVFIEGQLCLIEKFKFYLEESNSQNEV